MKDTTKEALLTAQRAIEAAYAACAHEAIDHPKRMVIVREAMGPLLHYAQTIDTEMLNAPLWDQYPQQVQQHAFHQAPADVPRGPAW